jgi:hypothetical protein
VRAASLWQSSARRHPVEEEQGREPWPQRRELPDFVIFFLFSRIGRSVPVSGKGA